MNKVFYSIGLSIFLLTGCKCPVSRNTDYTFTLNDSLYIKRSTVDTIINVPTSTVDMNIYPERLFPGDKVEKKSGQATVTVEKKEDGSLNVKANCDSMQIVVNSLTEEITKVSKQKEVLLEQVKAAPSRTKWFTIGFISAIGGLLLIWIIRKIKK